MVEKSKDLSKVCFENVNIRLCMVLSDLDTPLMDKIIYKSNPMQLCICDFKFI